MLSWKRKAGIPKARKNAAHKGDKVGSKVYIFHVGVLRYYSPRPLAMDKKCFLLFGIREEFLLVEGKGLIDTPKARNTAHVGKNGSFKVFYVYVGFLLLLPHGYGSMR